MAKQTGMTLIEVLVASFLLFAVLALATLTYRQSMLIDEKAQRQFIDALAIVFISELVEERLRQSPEAREGRLNWKGTEVTWQIVRTEEKNAKAGFDQETSTEVQFGKRLRLHEIEINLRGRSERMVSLSWN